MLLIDGTVIRLEADGTDHIGNLEDITLDGQLDVDILGILSVEERVGMFCGDHSLELRLGLWERLGRPKNLNWVSIKTLQGYYGEATKGCTGDLRE